MKKSEVYGEYISTCIETEYCPAVANTRQLWSTFLKYGKV